MRLKLILAYGSIAAIYGPRNLTVSFSFDARKHAQSKLIRVHITHFNTIVNTFIDTFINICIDTYVDAFVQHFNNTCIKQYPKYRQQRFSVIECYRIYISASYLDYSCFHYQFDILCPYIDDYYPG
ncbi:unnamed protein product [Clonostachys byssicola]|uniref:Uncharacterized protein n=1 Tax=Clonostachys byssicola TaxID=160290 RepID=A0A9N9YBI4_9HYPO|nr:unnamed protein product [Clonostachys byssicola]